MQDNHSPLRQTLEQIRDEFQHVPWYFDMNYVHERKLSISIDSSTSTSDKKKEKGVKVRVWDGEKFLEHASDDLRYTQIKEHLNQLIIQAEQNQVANPVSLGDERPIKEDYGPELNRPADTLHFKDKFNTLQSLHSEILNQKPDFLNVRCVYRETIEELVFVNKRRSLSQEVPVVLIAFLGFVKGEDGSPKSMLTATVSNGMEVFEQAKGKIPAFISKIRCLEISRPLSGGRYDVVLSPHLSGLLAHESFGHGMEADAMMKGRALATEWIGEQVGIPALNIVDEPGIEGCHGTLYFDQDGNLSEKTYLVKDGVVHDPIADRYSQRRCRLQRSGNGRMESFDHKHYTRMTNTYFENGDTPFDSLISQISDGLYITESNGGMEDPKGWGVQIQNCFAQRIKNGKLVEEYYDGFTLTGFLPEIMGNIEAVGNDFDMDDIGYCGKGHKEYVRVASGGPSLLIRKVILG